MTAVGAKRLDDTRHKLRELMQRWDNRLVLEGQSRVKAYIEGQASMVLVVKSGPAPRSWEGDVASNHDESADSFSRDLIVIVLSHVDARLGSANMGEQRPMLILSVQMVESNECVPSAVRAYFIEDEVGDIGGDSLYFSETRLTYQRFDLRRYREMQVRVRFLEGADDGPCEVIECGPQIVNRVSRHHLQSGHLRKEIGEVECDHHSLSVRAFIGKNSTFVRLVKGFQKSFHIADVLFGPLDL